jgi:stage 0 sporulation regulatory protein
METAVSVLLEEISERKRNMYKKAKHFGFTHPSVVKYSQELDNLLNKYQGVKNPRLTSKLYSV